MKKDRFESGSGFCAWEEDGKVYFGRRIGEGGSQLYAILTQEEYSEMVKTLSGRTPEPKVKI